MKLKELLEQATPLPLTSNGHGHISAHIEGFGPKVIAAANMLNCKSGDKQAAYLAHAGNMLPKLVEALE